MRKKDVAKGIGRAVRTAGKVAGKAAVKAAGKVAGKAGKVAGTKGKIGLAAAGVVLVAGAVVLAKKKRAQRKAIEGKRAVASKQHADGLTESAESASMIPVAADADLSPRGDSRKGFMTEAPVAGARFNGVRDDPTDGR